jgi:hypothetical protein
MEPKELRRRAVECDQKAGMVHNPEVRWQLRDVARQCRDLARQLEELDRLGKRVSE